MATLGAESLNATFDHREFPPPETNERFLDPTQIRATDEILLVGAGMRHADWDVLKARWADRYAVNGEPLLPAALEALQRMALTGMEYHFRTGKADKTTAHRLLAYDTIYAGSPHRTHSSFIGDISLVSQIQGKVFMFDDFNPTPAQADSYTQATKLLHSAADAHFEGLFYDEAQRAVFESDYNLSELLRELDPEVALAYLDKSFIVARMIEANRHARRSGDVAPKRFCTWMLRQRTLLEEHIHSQ